MKIVARIISIAFLLFWLLFVFADYWQKHVAYYYSFKLFEYRGFAVFLLVLGGGMVWSALKFGKQKKYQGFFNGITLFVLFLIISLASVGFAFGKLIEDLQYDLPKAMKALGQVGGSALAVYFIALTCYAAGRPLNKLLGIKVKKEDRLILDLAVGIMGFVLVLFLLGAVSLLYSFVVFPLMFALLAFQWRDAISFIKTTLVAPIATDKKLNVVGAIAAFLLVATLSINFTALHVPMPPGFDTLTLYANLPSLINQHHALVEGFQPYNWSLLMALGHVLFGSTPITLALSYLGGFLALVAVFVLGKSWLKLSVNANLVAVFSFSLIPIFASQMYAELKVDLGMLFFYLVTVILLFNYFKNRKEPETEKPLKGKSWLLQNREMLLTGLLTGFSMGIKLTTLYFAFALVCAIWYFLARERGMFASFLICLFLVFLLKIDETAGLREYHIGVDILKWGVLLAGLLLLAGIYFENKENLKESLRMTLLLGMFSLLPFLPWVVKNYVDTKSLNPSQLMSGKEASPEMNMQILEQNWQKTNQ